MVAWGDSLTFGSGSTNQATKSYPARLAAIASIGVSNQGVGGETSTQIKTRLLAASKSFTGKPTIIWAGRNNYSSSATVQSDIAAMVAALGHNNYLVLSILNSSNEPVGNLGYNQIAALNAALASTYGAHYLDVRSYLVSLYNPGQPQDVIDHANDVPPSSMRTDIIHLTDAGYDALAAFLYANRAQLGFN